MWHKTFRQFLQLHLLNTSRTLQTKERQKQRPPWKAVAMRKEVGEKTQLFAIQHLTQNSDKGLCSSKKKIQIPSQLPQSPAIQIS